MGNITELENLTLRSLSTLCSTISRTGEYNWVKKSDVTFFIESLFVLISRTGEYNWVKKSDVTFFINTVFDYIKDWRI